jgi:hypothetical protein
MGFLFILPCAAGEGDHAQHGGGGLLPMSVEVEAISPSVSFAASSPATQGSRETL